MGRYIPSPRALPVGFGVGLAERGQRRVEEPPLGLDQLGLEPVSIPMRSHYSEDVGITMQGTSIRLCGVQKNRFESLRWRSAPSVDARPDPGLNPQIQAVNLAAVSRRPK